MYCYTGVTSVGGDQSNVGFILTNQRTKETHFYSVAGATERSAMDSAEGELQNLRYTATFPLLLNVGGQPTYFMAMKDAAQLVKMYAMVNVQQYNIVATGNTVEECKQNYLDMMRSSRHWKWREHIPGRRDGGGDSGGDPLGGDGGKHGVLPAAGRSVGVLHHQRCGQPGDGHPQRRGPVAITYAPGEGDLLAASAVERK